MSRPEPLRHCGPSRAVESIHSRGTTPQIAALALGELDIAMLANSSFGLATVNASMDDLRVIADGDCDSITMYGSTPFRRRADSKSHKVEDLKERVPATIGNGSATCFVLTKMMHDHGFEEERDDVDSLIHLGFLKDTIDVRSRADLSIIDAAAERLRH